MLERSDFLEGNGRTETAGEGRANSLLGESKAPGGEDVHLRRRRTDT